MSQRQFKKLVLVLAIFALVTKANIKDILLANIFCIYYWVKSQKNNNKFGHFIITKAKLIL